MLRLISILYGNFEYTKLSSTTGAKTRKKFEVIYDATAAATRKINTKIQRNKQNLTQFCGNLNASVVPEDQ